MGQHRHERWRRPLVLVDRVVVLAIDAAVNGMNDPVALAAAGRLEKGSGEDPFATGSEHDFDRVIHSSGHYRLDAGPVRPCTEYMGSPRYEWRLAGAIVGLFGESSFAPVD